eukprot:4954307-Pyramimonas_sp.AAC.1
MHAWSKRSSHGPQTSGTTVGGGRPFQANGPNERRPSAMHLPMDPATSDRLCFLRGGPAAMRPQNGSNQEA